MPNLFDQYGSEIVDISSHYGPVFDASGVQVGEVNSNDGSAAIGALYVAAFSFLVMIVVKAVVGLVRLTYLGIVSLRHKKYKAATAYLALPVATLGAILIAISYVLVMQYDQEIQKDRVKEALALQVRQTTDLAVKDLNLHPELIKIVPNNYFPNQWMFEIRNYSKYTIGVDAGQCGGNFDILENSPALVSCYKKDSPNFCPVFYYLPDRLDWSSKVRLDKSICK